MADPLQIQTGKTPYQIIVNTPSGNAVEIVNNGAVVYSVDANGTPIGALRGTYDVPRRQKYLRRFHAALALRATAPVNVAVIGNSISDGYAASAMSKRYIELLQTQLRTAYQPAGVAGGLAYQTAGVYTGGTPAGRITLANAPALTQAGWGLRAVTLANNTQTLTLTASMTGFDLYYFCNPAGGTATFTVDGVQNIGGCLVTPQGGSPAAMSAGTCIVNSTVGTNFVASRRVQVRALSHASHTIVVTGPASSSVIFEGIDVFDQDETAGIRVLDNSRTGTASASYTGGQLTNLVATFAVTQPQLILIEIGVNDWSQGVAVPTFTANVKAMIASLRAQYSASTLPSIVLAATHQCTSPATTFAPFVNALYAIAAADGSIGVIDMWERMGGFPNDQATTLLADGTHCNDQGQQYWADAIYQAIIP